MKKPRLKVGRVHRLVARPTEAAIGCLAAQAGKATHRKARGTMTTHQHTPGTWPTGLVCASMLAGLFISTVPAVAQMTSTAELKLACETSSGNVVAINVNTQVSTGPRPPLAEVVHTPCTLVLASNVSFSAGQVGMSFNGPFTIQGGSETHALFIESEFVGSAVTVTQADKSSLLLDRSLLQASAGSIAITTGAEGTLDIQGPIVSGNLVASGAITVSGGQKFHGTTANAQLQAGAGLSMTMNDPESSLVLNTSTLSAGDAITVTGGTKFVAQLNDTEMQAGTGLSVALNGAEGLFSAVSSGLNTTAGAVSITSVGTKGFIDLKLGSVVTAGSGLTVSLDGNESTLDAHEFTFNGGTGSVSLQAQGNLSKLTAAVGTVSASGSVTIQAATAAQLGIAHLEEAEVNAGGDMRLETGSLGNTTAKGNTLTSPTLVRIASGAGGVCTSLENIMTAPVQQICP